MQDGWYFSGSRVADRGSRRMALFTSMTIDRRRSKHMPPLGHLVPSPERPRNGPPARQEFPESHDVFRAEFPDVGRSRMRGLPYYPSLYFFPTSPLARHPRIRRHTKWAALLRVLCRAPRLPLRLLLRNVRPQWHTSCLST